MPKSDKRLWSGKFNKYVKIHKHINTYSMDRWGKHTYCTLYLSPLTWQIDWFTRKVNRQINELKITKNSKNQSIANTNLDSKPY